MPKYIIVSISEGEGHYEEFEPRLLKRMVPLKKSIKFDPRNPPKELLDLIPFVN